MPEDLSDAGVANLTPSRTGDSLGSWVLVLLIQLSVKGNPREHHNLLGLPGLAQNHLTGGLAWHLLDDLKRRLVG